MKMLFPVLIGLTLLFASIIPVQSCTLWTAAGKKVTTGGVLIAKNRDWQPDHYQELRLIQPRQGRRYLGLFAINGAAPGLKAGINESGLVVISATASSIPSRTRMAEPATKNVLTQLLTQCASVDQALVKQNYFKGSRFIMLADRTKTALVEIAPHGKRSTKVVANGLLYHTNHYLAPELLWANQRIGTSSRTRLQRIQFLLATSSDSFSLDDFIKFSNDQNAGPDRSIWRSGRSPRATRTLAAWIIWLPPHGDPQLYLKIANPNQAPTLQRLNITNVFKRSTSPLPNNFIESPLQ